jgi:hypothetical protein
VGEADGYQVRDGRAKVCAEEEGPKLVGVDPEPEVKPEGDETPSDELAGKGIEGEQAAQTGHGPAGPVKAQDGTASSGSRRGLDCGSEVEKEAEEKQPGPGVSPDQTPVASQTL